MSGSRWVITPPWLSGSWSSFLYSSSVYSCHLFLISYASVRSIPFLFFIVPIFTWKVPLVSLIFFKRSLVFPILLFSSISLHWSLWKAFLYFLAILWNFAFKWVYLPFSPLPFLQTYTGLTQDWGNRLLEGTNKPWAHQDPGERSSDPTRDWHRLVRECPRRP